MKMKKILYYVTDHGLGHLTRSISIIREFDENVEFIIRNSNEKFIFVPEEWERDERDQRAILDVASNSMSLLLNILVMNYSPEERDLSVYNTCIEYNQNYNSIVLMYQNQDHFQLVGYYDDDNMISYFKELPEELKKLFKINQ